MTEQKKADKRPSINEKVAAIAALIAGFVTVAALVGSLLGFLKQPPGRAPSISDTVIAQAEEIRELKDNLQSVNQKLERIELSITSLSKIPDESKLAIELNRVSGSVTEMQNKVANIEQVVIDNPSKALGIPLLRKDLDNLKESYKSDVLSVRQEIERVYDLNKWFVGLMFTMALSVLGLAISNLYKGKEKESK